MVRYQACGGLFVTAALRMTSCNSGSWTSWSATCGMFGACVKRDIWDLSRTRWKQKCFNLVRCYGTRRAKAAMALETSVSMSLNDLEAARRKYVRYTVTTFRRSARNLVACVTIYRDACGQYPVYSSCSGVCSRGDSEF